MKKENFNRIKNHVYECTAIDQNEKPVTIYMQRDKVNDFEAYSEFCTLFPVCAGYSERKVKLVI